MWLLLYIYIYFNLFFQYDNYICHIDIIYYRYFIIPERFAVRKKHDFALEWRRSN